MNGIKGKNSLRANLSQVELTVSSSSQIANSWIAKHVFRKDHDVIVGVDTESHLIPHQPNQLATIQLSVGHACLLFRCLHVASLPLLVVRVLESPRVLKLANGMRGDQAQILRSFEIGFQGCADVSDWFGSLQTASNEGRAVSLSKLGTDVLGVSTEGGAVMTMSDWKADHLSLAQVHYACMDACLAREVGVAVLAGSLGLRSTQADLDHAMEQSAPKRRKPGSDLTRFVQVSPAPPEVTADTTSIIDLTTEDGGLLDGEPRTSDSMFLNQDFVRFDELEKIKDVQRTNLCRTARMIAQHSARFGDFLQMKAREDPKLAFLLPGHPQHQLFIGMLEEERSMLAARPPSASVDSSSEQAKVIRTTRKRKRSRRSAILAGVMPLVRLATATQQVWAGYGLTEGQSGSVSKRVIDLTPSVDESPSQPLPFPLIQESTAPFKAASGVKSKACDGLNEVEFECPEQQEPECQHQYWLQLLNFTPLGHDFGCDCIACKHFLAPPRQPAGEFNESDGDW